MMVDDPAADAALRNWATIVLARDVLKGVTDELELHGVSSVPVKGIVLAHQIYADVLERPIADVDLLVRSSDFFKVQRVARSLRWQTVWDSKTLGSVNFVISGIAVDVKSSIAPPGMSAIGTAEVIRRARYSIAPLGFRHLAIDVHDHALLLAVDAFKDKLRLTVRPWAAQDLLRIARQPGFDPRRFVALARAARLQTLVHLVSSWACEHGADTALTAVRDELASQGVRFGFERHYLRLARQTQATTLQSFRLSVLARTASDNPLRRLLALGLGAIGTTTFVLRHGGVGADPWRRAPIERRRGAG